MLVIRVLLLSSCLFLVGCSSAFFFPMEGHVRTPADVGLEYKNVDLLTKEGVKIHGWFLPAAGGVKGTVYFLHGNAENISTHLQAVYWLPERGYQVFLIDYQGFGLSEGTSTLPNALMDIETGFKWLMKQEEVVSKPVFLMGQSLGASMAVYFSATNEYAKACLSGVISDAAFTRYSDIIQHVANQGWLTWSLQYPASWLAVSGYDPVDYIRAISPAPLLVIHSQDDRVIPFQYSSKLFDEALPYKRRLVTNGGHVTTFNSQENREVLISFLADAAKASMKGCGLR